MAAAARQKGILHFFAGLVASAALSEASCIASL